MSKSSLTTKAIRSKHPWVEEHQRIRFTTGLCQNIVFVTLFLISDMVFLPPTKGDYIPYNRLQLFLETTQEDRS